MNDQDWLEGALEEAGATAGTVHRLRGGVLVLSAAVDIPAAVCAAVAEIPHGKGMAGRAWERDAPVETCDLKTDETGDVRPGARAVDAHAAVAIPVHDDAGQVCGVVGVAFHHERAPDTPTLVPIAEGLPPFHGTQL